MFFHSFDCKITDKAMQPGCITYATLHFATELQSVRSEKKITKRMKASVALAYRHDAIGRWWVVWCTVVPGQ